ncbi:hypothetical protein [Capnocytophaga gingivalis]|nr:hypothetical protein [Capnocytophaga gingivalis]
MYYPRLIDSYLKEWAERPARKPLLLRGARQVGKWIVVRVCPLFALSQLT